MIKPVILTNKLGMEVSLSPVGAGIYNIALPIGKKGQLESMVAQPRDFEDYIYADGSFGKTCGRTAGRISNAEFTLNNHTYHIQHKPNRDFALHGGIEGISNKLFDYVTEDTDEGQKVTFTYLSKDLEGGYPGNMKIQVVYLLMKDKNTLHLEHNVISDQDTLCNLTNHCYFNLSGNCKTNVLNHDLFIRSHNVGLVNSKTIAEKLIPVDKYFDFTKAHPIGDYIESEAVQNVTKGYDHPYMLDDHTPQDIVVSLKSPTSKVQLSIQTSYESVVVYSANYPSNYLFSNGKPYAKYDAICLEMQHFPNTINSSFISDKKDVIKKDQENRNFIDYTFEY